MPFEPADLLPYVGQEVAVPPDRSEHGRPLAAAPAGAREGAAED
jgi:hypothetical protein